MRPIGLVAVALGLLAAAAWLLGAGGGRRAQCNMPAIFGDVTAAADEPPTSPEEERSPVSADAATGDESVRGAPDGRDENGAAAHPDALVLVGRLLDLDGRPLADTRCVVDDAPWVGFATTSGPGWPPGSSSALVVSSASAAVIAAVPAESPYYWGGELSVTDDIDGDSFEDLLVNELPPSGLDSSAVAIGSVSAKLLYRHESPPTVSQDDYPRELKSLGDVDQDGAAEWLVSSRSDFDAQLGVVGTVRVLSRRPLVATPDSAEPGDVVSLELNAGVQNAGSPYLVLASSSGTAGISFGAVTIPLTYDSTTAYSILLRNTPVFPGTYGTTEPRTGSALAAFDTTYVPQALYGNTFWFAAIGLGPNGHFVSNPAPVNVTTPP